MFWERFQVKCHYHMSYLNFHPNRERFRKVNNGPLECKKMFMHVLCQGVVFV